MPRTEKYFVGPALLSDIRKTITRVAGMPDSANAPGFRTAATEMPRRAGGGFRICTFTGAWATATSKVVTFKNQATTPNTVSAVNLTMHLPDIGLTPPFDCLIARGGTAWYLISAIEHNVKRGTFAAPWNKNTTKTVSLVNGGSVSALNRHANITGSGTRNCTVGRDNMDWELIAAEC